MTTSDSVELPEWPKAGEHYVWFFDDPAKAIGVFVKDVAVSGGRLVVTFLTQNQFSGVSAGVTCVLLKAFQEACEPYRRHLFERAQLTALESALTETKEQLAAVTSDKQIVSEQLFQCRRLLDDAREHFAASEQARERAEQRIIELQNAVSELCNEQFETGELVKKLERRASEAERELGEAKPTPIWTKEQVAELFRHQLEHKYHPYTCGNRSDHPVVMGDKGVLIPTIYGWICPFCDYKQSWSHQTGGNGVEAIGFPPTNGGAS